MHSKIKLSAAILFSTISFSSLAQFSFDEVQIKATALKGSVHMLEGAGGNIGVSAGSDGILIVDDQYAPLAEKISAVLGQLGSNKPNFIINTHFHGDHTGSNAYFHEQHAATIVAHSNVRLRLVTNEEVSPAAYPAMTFDDGVKIYFNKETIHVFHLPDAHTDGDSAVWFEQPDILHTGDLFFNGMFPYIDLNGGGTVPGYIAAVETLLSKIDDDTVVIAGHGPLANKADLQRFLDMIKATNTIVDTKKAQGWSVEQIIEQGLGAEWESWAWRFITEEFWIKTLFNS